MESSDFRYAFNLKRMLEVFAQPREHPTELSLLVGMAILIAFALIVLFALVFVRASSKKKRGDKERQDPKRLGVILVVLGAVILLGYLVSYTLVAGPSLCLSCHDTPEVTEGLGVSAHAKVACQDCHFKPGIAGSIAYRLEVGRMALRRVLGTAGESLSGSASKEACLTCHGGIAGQTITAKSIKMSHRQPIDKGYACDACHSGVAHGAREKTAAMPVCYDCHNRGKPVACGSCHVKQAGAAVISLDEYTKVTISAEMICERCHK